MVPFSQASENLGMAMMYTLASSAKDWLSEHYGQDDGDDYAEEEAAKEDEVLQAAVLFMSYAFFSFVIFLSKFLDTGYRSSWRTCYAGDICGMEREI